MSWALYLIGLHKYIQAKIHEELDSIFGSDLEREITNEDISDMKYLDCVIKVWNNSYFLKLIDLMIYYITHLYLYPCQLLGIIN